MRSSIHRLQHHNAHMYQKWQEMGQNYYRTHGIAFKFIFEVILADQISMQMTVYPSCTLKKNTSNMHIYLISVIRHRSIVVDLVYLFIYAIFFVGAIAHHPIHTRTHSVSCNLVQFNCIAIDLRCIAIK